MLEIVGFHVYIYILGEMYLRFKVYIRIWGIIVYEKIPAPSPVHSQSVVVVCTFIGEILKCK